MVVVGFGVSIFDSIFFLTPLNSLASSLSMKAAKELVKEGKKETKISFKFQLYFSVLYGYFVARKYLPGPLEKQLYLPNKALKCTCRFQCVLSPKLMLLVVGDKSNWCFQYRLLLEETQSYAKYKTWADTCTACKQARERRPV